MFFAPALLWIGAALLLVRLRGRLLGRGLARGAAARAAEGDAVGFVLASAARRGAAINRGLLAVGLLLAFGVNLGIFAATYDQQAGVDAQLTLGADVAATAPPGVAQRHNLAAKVAARARREGDERRRPLLRLRRAPTSRTPTGSKPRPQPRDDPARLLLPRRQRAGDDAGCARRPTGSSSPRRRSPITPSGGRSAAPARPRPPHRQVPGRPLPRRRHRAGVPLGAEGLVHGRQPAPTSRPPTSAAGRTSCSRRPAETRPGSRAASPRRPRATGTRSRTSASRPAQTVSSITTVDLTGISRIERGLRDRARRRGDGAVRRARHRTSAATSSRRWRRSARRCATIGAFVWSEAALVLAAATSSRRCSAGCWRRCSWRCSSTSSTRRRTTSPCPGASSAACSARPRGHPRRRGAGRPRAATPAARASPA